MLIDPSLRMVEQVKWCQVLVKVELKPTSSTTFLNIWDSVPDSPKVENDFLEAFEDHIQ